MKQFLLPHGVLSDGTVRLDGKDFRYLVRVRRIKAGDTLTVALPDGKPALMLVTEVGAASLTAVVQPEDTGGGTEAGAAVGVKAGVKSGAVNGAGGAGVKSGEGTGPPSIVLFQALPKPAKMDLIVRQAAEAGVHEIVPFISERSGRVPWGSPGAASRAERWRRIVREARQQSGSPVDTLITEPPSGISAGISAVLAVYAAKQAAVQTAAGRTTAFVMSERPPAGKGGPNDAARRSFHEGLTPPPRLVCIAVGPEGGFSAQETRLFADNGFISVTVGLWGTVLRVETAAAWAVAAVSVILGENESWKLKE